MEDGSDGSRRPAWNDGHSEVAVHPSSINHMLAANQYQRPYQIYLEKVGLASCACKYPRVNNSIGGLLACARLVKEDQS